MQYFVTLSLLRSHVPQLFISGDHVGGHHHFDDVLTFDSLEGVQARVELAGLPADILKRDLLSPFLVSAQQLHMLGVTALQ